MNRILLAQIRRAVWLAWSGSRGVGSGRWLTPTGAGGSGTPGPWGSPIDTLLALQRAVFTVADTATPPPRIFDISDHNYAGVAMALVEGEVYKIVEDGVAYFRSESLPDALGFTLDKIPGYRGEYPSELGLYEGSRVTVELDPETQMIAKVHLNRTSRRRRRLFF